MEAIPSAAASLESVGQGANCQTLGLSSYIAGRQRVGQMIVQEQRTLRDYRHKFAPRFSAVVLGDVFADYF